jgi:NAD-dependent dihydropyrimidine dehydrogenase PreA subunit
MKREIIKIDENKCNGCGICISNCPEGAIQLIDGKARLVGELLCDGLGACIGKCPEGAISVEEREAQAYDEVLVLKNIISAGGNVLTAHLKHLFDHQQNDYLQQALNYLETNKIPIPQYKNQTKNTEHKGCPSVQPLQFKNKVDISQNTSNQSQLSQWPIQLQLLNPSAPYFKNADLVIAADCVPFSYANFHERFLKNKILIIFCPKLDQTIDAYVEKLTAIFKNNNIQSITLVHMEVPCCGGVGRLVEKALHQSSKNIVIKDYTISLNGNLV